MSNVTNLDKYLGGELEWPSIATIPYMGSKTRLLHDLCPILLDAGRTHTVVDLFAGSGSVGYALKELVDVAANDVQRYAFTLNEAVLNGARLTEDDEAALRADIRGRCGRATSQLSDLLRIEQQLLTGGTTAEYIEFCNSTPSVANPDVGVAAFEELRSIVSHVLRAKAAHTVPSGDALFTTYYGNTYFGLRQCVEIDAVRASIEALEDAGQKYVLLTALMNAMSACVSATTHFAQYLRPRDARTVEHLVSKRSQSIVDLTGRALEYYRSRGLLDSSPDSVHRIVGNSDFIDFLGACELGPGTTVYADPPYFKEHYSRYYHVLETLCLYDYPSITFNPRLGEYTVGRYRDDRYVSSFGRKSTALSGFQQLSSVCASAGASLVVSYSDNSIITVEEIAESLTRDFDISEVRISAKHSTQGRKSLKDVQEVILSARPRTRRSGMQPGIAGLEKALSGVEPVFETPLTGMHPYTARKPLNVLDAVMRTVLPEKGSVLDPFAGSGSTLLAARRLGHDVFGWDLSQVSEIVCKATLLPWPSTEVAQHYRYLLQALSETSRGLFAIDVEGRSAVLERCHFDLVGGQMVPQSYWYRLELPGGELGPRVHRQADETFRNEYSRVEAASSGALPGLHMIANSRIAIPSGAQVADYFCARNRLLLQRLLDMTAASGGRTPYDELLVSSAISLLRLSDKKASTQLPFWIPKKDITSRNGLEVLWTRADQIVAALEYAASECAANPHGRVSFQRAPFQSASVDALPDSSIDLVLTDPPYTDQVPYLEYGQIQALLLGWDMLDPDVLREELVVSNAPSRPDKTRDAFNAQLALALHRTSRCLKPNAHLVMFFHDFSLKAWAGLISSAQDAGLAYEGQVDVPRKRRSFKSILSPKRTLHGEYLVVFSKRCEAVPVFLGDYEAARARACSIARDIVRSAGGEATSQDLYDQGLLRDAVSVGYLDVLAARHETFLDVVGDQLAFVEGKWRLA